MTIDWQSAFRDAHLTSWPRAGLRISRVSPEPGQGSRKIYDADKMEIHAAAERFGYQMTEKTQSHVSFTHPTLAGMAGLTWRPIMNDRDAMPRAHDFRRRGHAAFPAASPGLPTI
jgi:hypothetical protein